MLEVGHIVVDAKNAVALCADLDELAIYDVALPAQVWVGKYERTDLINTKSVKK